MKPVLFGGLDNVDISSTEGVFFSYEKEGSVIIGKEVMVEDLSSKDPSLEKASLTFLQLRSVSESILERDNMNSCTSDESPSRRSSSTSSEGEDDTISTSHPPQHLLAGHEAIQATSQLIIGSGGVMVTPRAAEYCAIGEDSRQDLKVQHTVGSPRHSTSSSSSRTSPKIPNDITTASKVTIPPSQPPRPSLPADAVTTGQRSEERQQDSSPADDDPTNADVSGSSSFPIQTEKQNIHAKESEDGRSVPSKPDLLHSLNLTNEGIEGWGRHADQDSSTNTISTVHSCRPPLQPSDLSLSLTESNTRESVQPDSQIIAWTMGQHRDFVSAIFSLGLTHCSPSVIMEEMKHLPKDISRENIKSHLQKFRKTADKSVEDFMQEFDAFLHRIENEPTTKTVPPPNSSSSSTQASKEHEKSFEALETVMAGLDPTELLGGAAAAYAAYAVVHNYAPRNDRNKILYEGTREELPRLTAAEQESSLGRSLKQVKGALDFVRDLVLKRRHGIPFKLDKKIPPFLKKEDVAEHLPVISRHTSDVSDQNTRNNIYSGPVPNHVNMTVPAAPIYGPPHDYHYPAPGYPSHYSYPTADGSHGPFSRYGSQPPSRGGYASYGEFHHPVMHNMPPPSGYPSLHYNPYQVGPYMHPESAHPVMPDHYPPPMHPSTGTYPGTMDSSHYSIMGLPPQQYHAAPDVYFEPPHNSATHFQQYPEEPAANPVRSSGTHKTSSRTSVPFYPSKSGSLERGRETFDTTLQTTTRPSKTAHSPTESTSTKRQWSPIVSAPLDEPDPGHTKHQHKRPKTELAVDTSASCSVDRPLSYELADLGLHPGPDTPDTHDVAVEGGSQSSPFSVTSVLRNAMMMHPPKSTTPDRVVLDFGRSVPTPSEDDRRHRRSRRDRDHGTPFPS